MKQLLKNLLFIIIICFFFFLIVEGISLLALKFLVSQEKPDERNTALIEDDWYIYTAELGWEFKPYYDGPVTGITRSFDQKGGLKADTEQRLAADMTKVLFLGDSITYGYGIGTEDTFVEIADRMIPDMACINLGVPGYSSYQALKMLEKYGREIEPDIVIAAFNYNDRRYVLFPGNIDSDEKFRAIMLQNRYDRISRFLSRFGMYRLMRSLLSISAVHSSYREIEWIGQIDMNTVFPRVSKESYRRNLEQIHEITSSRGISLVFMLLNDNPRYTDPVRKGVGHLNNSLYDEAIHELLPASSPQNKFSALARVYLSQAYIHRGETDKARQVYVLDNAYHSIAGGTPLYLDDEYNEIMRQVAGENNIPVIDAGGLLSQTPELYLDFCHFNREGHIKVAEALVSHLSQY